LKYFPQIGKDADPTIEKWGSEPVTINSVLCWWRSLLGLRYFSCETRRKKKGDISPNTRRDFRTKCEYNRLTSFHKSDGVYDCPTQIVTGRLSSLERTDLVGRVVLLAKILIRSQPLNFSSDDVDT